MALEVELAGWYFYVGKADEDLKVSVGLADLEVRYYHTTTISNNKIWFNIYSQMIRPWLKSILNLSFIIYFIMMIAFIICVVQAHVTIFRSVLYITKVQRFIKHFQRHICNKKDRKQKFFTQ